MMSVPESPFMSLDDRIEKCAPVFLMLLNKKSFILVYRKEFCKLRNNVGSVPNVWKHI